MIGTQGHTLKGRRLDPRSEEQRLKELGLYDPMEYLSEEPDQPSDVPWDLPGWVYVVSALDLVKIGLAAEPQRRLAALRNQNAAAITVLFMRAFGKYDTAIGVERALHAAFAAHRHHGEWFSLDQAGIAALKIALNTSEDR